LPERLKIESLCKSHGGRKILDNFSLSLAGDDVLAVLGYSGSGKTTLLNIIAGLETADAGSIQLSGDTIESPARRLPSHLRQLGMVFQDQMLWPHMTVVEHLDFVLRARKIEKSQRPGRIAEMLETMRLTGREKALPAQLSGGERQRVGIARALIAKPSLLLLDEPCANLDAPLKSELIALLKTLQRQYQFAALYVTHDIREAAALTSRIAVLDQGRLIQEGALEELTSKPQAPVVTRLIEGTRIA
jgi:ABC-type Fe3+/spermidine/putrescine transport system ATPase subunit